MAPSEIIPNFLFVGGVEEAEDWDTLTSLGIKNIINLTKHCGCYPNDSGPFTYLNIPVMDIGEADIKSHFEKTNAFIDEARGRGEKVLVHCRAGISRAPTIVMAYILKNSSNASVVDVYEFVRRRRPIVAPNMGFIGQLFRYKQEMGYSNDDCITEERKQ